VPKVNKLGSDVWNKLKEKTKVKVKEIAFDLIKLYAQRKAQDRMQSEMARITESMGLPADMKLPF
jgi:transcription-repair coupling factor (superfamily II helicase)